MARLYRQRMAYRIITACKVRGLTIEIDRFIPRGQVDARYLDKRSRSVLPERLRAEGRRDAAES
jgi:hypothetical protein